ncbi:hypothetical protein Dehly_1569 [Dehalogenimonas lykanthroporepellens BL-DC-9]|nr:hypothetical protein Dehly_1569 [Dehalogenimonas lykanthroporepellens BL-DC-9]
MNGRNARHRQGLRLMIVGLVVYRSAGNQAAVEPETRA